MTQKELEILLSEEVQKQIELHIEMDPDKIALEKHLEHAREIASQVKYLQRARKKLPEIYAARCIIPSLAFQQSSSQACAQSRNFEGRLCIDLTCGLGIDSIYLSRRFEKVMAIERDAVLAAVAAENFKRLGIDNIEIVNLSAERFIESFSGRADLIFADPDRRDKDGKKMVLLQDCSPDIAAMLPRLEQIAEHVAIKLSPMFDVSQALRTFGPDVRISALSVDGECKELMVECGQKISSTTLTAKAAGKDEVSFALPDKSLSEHPAIDRDANMPEKKGPAEKFSPDKYACLIVPDVALQKIRCVKRYFDMNGIYFYSENGYGFCSHSPKHIFGRALEIESIEPFSPKTLKQELKRQGIRSIDIMRREFPLTAAQIASQIGVRQGGKTCICFTRINGRSYQIRLRLSGESQNS